MSPSQPPDQSGKRQPGLSRHLLRAAPANVRNYFPEIERRRQTDETRWIAVPEPGYAKSVGLIVYLIILFFVGLFVGALARLLVPGPDPMGIGMTALIGVCGTFSAGLFSWYVLHRHGGGILLSILFSMLVVWIYRQSRGGSYRSRGARRRGRL
jgi:uncharacterized membrane protein YeaQ/YmgE (transglycosylase-associated protein family)